MTISYKHSGVNYNLLDPIKKMAQAAGIKTRDNFRIKELKELSYSRGESAYVMESDDCYFAFVQEGLGTKNLVADQMRKITGKTYYDAIAQDTVAMIVNDLITVGAKPLTVLAYWAVGDSNWFTDKIRSNDLICGWKIACDLAQVVWGAGETPILKDIVNPSTIDLAGCAFGIVKPKSRLVLGDRLSIGDEIICFESNGIHANGLTLVRELAKKLPFGFAEKLPGGELFGEEILKPTFIYSKLIQDILDSDIDIHYMVNITGHGWRKLMRAKKSFSYIIDELPRIPDIFNFIQDESNLSNKEMYATFNMGAGYAIFVEKRNTEKILSICKKHNIKFWIAGHVENGSKKIIIKPRNITYNADELNIR